MQKDVFISYSRKDSNIVRLIKEEIEQKTKMICWIDMDDIPSGTPQFTENIVNGIKESLVFLFMLSMNSQDSSESLKEIKYAYDSTINTDKKVVIVNIDNCGVSDVFRYNFGLADIIDWNDESEHEKLIRDLKKWRESKYLYPIYISEQKKYGYIDVDGNIRLLLQHDWDMVDYYSQGLAKVKIDNKYGFIDKEGEIVIVPLYDDVEQFSEGLARVEVDRKYGFINKKGKFVIEPKYDDAATFFSEGLISVATYQRDKFGFNDRIGFVDVKGKIKLVLPPNNDCILCGFHEGLTPFIDTTGLGGYMNKHGDIVINPQYEFVSFFSDNMACVSMHGKWGFINRQGVKVIDYVYDNEPSWFQEGLCSVGIKDKYGYINKRGLFQIKPMFDAAFDFSGGVAVVRVSGKSGLIDKGGNFLVKPQYDYLRLLEGDLIEFYSQEQHLSGYIDKSGHIVYQW